MSAEQEPEKTPAVPALSGHAFPASQVASQVGAFATTNRATASTRAPRPALAPAHPDVLARIKTWVVDALGGAPLRAPGVGQPAAQPARDGEEEQDDDDDDDDDKEAARGVFGGNPSAALPLEVYVRQMACRKPDCVPLETVIILLGEGWHDKVGSPPRPCCFTTAHFLRGTRTPWHVRHTFLTRNASVHLYSRALTFPACLAPGRGA